MHRWPAKPISPLFKRLAAGTLVAAGCALAGTAQADVVKNFTLSFDGFNASGSLTVADTPTTGDFRLITSISGFLNGEAMTLLAVDAFPASVRNDNLLDIDTAELTYNGMSWASGGQWWNLYFDIGAFTACRGPVNNTVGCNQFFDDARFTLSDPVTAAVPTPATLPLVALGGLALLAARRKRLPC